MALFQKHAQKIVASRLWGRYLSFVSAAKPILHLQRFETQLARTRIVEPQSEKRAAVAAILRFPSVNDPEVLLMRRAKREGDRWSGQVSFPGGKEEAEDSSLLHTAIRETHEEVGINLNSAGRLLGGLDAIPAVARGKVLSTTISPYVFVQENEVPISLSAEADRAFWLPLRPAHRGDYRSSYSYRSAEFSGDLPCWRYDDEVIWGLTYTMLCRLLDKVSAS